MITFDPITIANQIKMSEDQGLPWKSKCAGNLYMLMSQDDWKVAEGFTLVEAMYASSAANYYPEALKKLAALITEHAELVILVNHLVQLYDQGIIEAAANGNVANGVDEGEVRGMELLDNLIERIRPYMTNVTPDS